jgi:hypothetical protein
MAAGIAALLDEKNRLPWSIAALVLFGISGILGETSTTAARTSVANLAEMVLPRMAQAEQKAVVAAAKAERVAENLAKSESGFTADLIREGNAPPSTPPPGSQAEDRTLRLGDRP